MPRVARDLSAFHYLLESAEVILHLLRWLFAQELRDCRSELAGRRIVAEHHPNLGSAAIAYRAEVDRARIAHIRAGKRAPGDELVLDLIVNDGIPFDFRAGWGLRDPTGAGLVDDGDRVQMIHEPRQVLEIAPEAVDLLYRPIDRHALLDLDPLAPAHARHRADPTLASR